MSKIPKKGDFNSPINKKRRKSSISKISNPQIKMRIPTESHLSESAQNLIIEDTVNRLQEIEDRNILTTHLAPPQKSENINRVFIAPNVRDYHNQSIGGFSAMASNRTRS